jgi:L-threonylcarbamoyladenylate synthase
VEGEILVTPGELARYVEVLRRGGVVACATETLVGLLADALDHDAVERVARIKGRPEESPIAVLIPAFESAATVASSFPDQAQCLALRHWPGPLTLILPARPGVPSPLTRDGTIGVRVPGPSPALDLCRAFGGPLTATSANRTGEPPARTAAEVEAALGAELDAIVPADAPGGLPSTVVDATVSPPRVVLAGAITRITED